MTEVLLSIQKNQRQFNASLIQAPNTSKQHTHGSVGDRTKTEAVNKAYRMAHQKRLSISHVFDEDEMRSLPVHQYKIGDSVMSSAPKAPNCEGVIDSFEGWNVDGVPQYWMVGGGRQLVLENEIKVIK